jgi:hypothetical protein
MTPLMAREDGIGGQDWLPEEFEEAYVASAVRGKSWNTS